MRSQALNILYISDMEVYFKAEYEKGKAGQSKNKMQNKN